MEPIASRIYINAAFKERLTFMQGLIQSARQGNGNQHRLWPERTADGSYRWRYQTAAGTTRDNLRLKYGELIQGFRVIVLGTTWGSKVYGVGRKAVSANLYFKSASAPGIDTNVWGNVAVPALWQDISDENDLQRRVNQMAREVGKFGKSVALGLRVSGLESSTATTCATACRSISTGVPLTPRAMARATGPSTVYGVPTFARRSRRTDAGHQATRRRHPAQPRPDPGQAHRVTPRSGTEVGLIGTHLAATSISYYCVPTGR